MAAQKATLERRRWMKSGRLQLRSQIRELWANGADNRWAGCRRDALTLSDLALVLTDDGRRAELPRLGGNKGLIRCLPGCGIRNRQMLDARIGQPRYRYLIARYHDTSQYQLGRDKCARSYSSSLRHRDLNISILELIRRRLISSGCCDGASLQLVQFDAGEAHPDMLHGKHACQLLTWGSSVS